MNQANVLALGLVSMLAIGCGDSTAPNDEAAPELNRGGASAARQSAVYVVHGINGSDLSLDQSLPVDVSINGACALQGLTFRTIAGPLKVPAGTYDIQVRLANPSAPCTGGLAIDAPGVAVPAGISASIVAHLDPSGAPKASVFVNDLSRTPGRARLVVRHTADFTAVDVLIDRKVVVAGATNGLEGAVVVRPGNRTGAIAVAGTSTLAFEGEFRVKPRTVYIGYAVGTPEKGTFEVLLQTLDQR